MTQEQRDQASSQVMTTLDPIYAGDALWLMMCTDRVLDRQGGCVRQYRSLRGVQGTRPPLMHTELFRTLEKRDLIKTVALGGFLGVMGRCDKIDDRLSAFEMFRAIVEMDTTRKCFKDRGASVVDHIRDPYAIEFLLNEMWVGYAGSQDLITHIGMTDSQLLYVESFISNPMKIAEHIKNDSQFDTRFIECIQDRIS